MKRRCQRNRRNRALERPNVDGMHIQIASVEDAAAIAEIYNQGIEDRVATYETKRRSAEDQQTWLKPLLVVIPPLLRKSTAKSSAGPALARTGIGNVIGASANFRCTSIATGDVEGWVIYCSLVSSAKRSGWGCGNWLSRIFHFNEASRALCRKHGFREVGVYEKHARLDNRWLDVVIVERLIPANLNAVSL